MTVIYVLIPIAILLTIVGIYLFFWAVKTEQFNDLEKQGLSILFDDETQQGNITNNNVEATSVKEDDPTQNVKKSAGERSEKISTTKDNSNSNDH